MTRRMLVALTLLFSIALPGGASADLVTGLPDATIYAPADGIWSSLSVGDVNGDGYGDIAITDAFYSNPEEAEGAVFIFHGSAAGIVSQDRSNADTLIETDVVWAQLSSIRPFGDVNGDGYDDVGLFIEAAGAVYIFHGSASGITSGNLTADASTILPLPFTTFSDFTAAGNFDGDPYGDVAFGDPKYTNGQLYEGAVHVYSGSAGGLLAGGFETTIESNQAGATLPVLAFFPELLPIFALDVDGDGYDDIVATFPGYDNTLGGVDYGSSFVFLSPGATSFTVTSVLGADTEIESDTLAVTSILAAVPAGDIQGDGYEDLSVVIEGSSYLFYGSNTGVSSGALSLSADATFVGTAIGGVGDVDGDGYDDVVTNGPTFYRGSIAGLVATTWTTSTSPDPPDYVSGIGDIDGDGKAEIQARVTGGDPAELQIYHHPTVTVPVLPLPALGVLGFGIVAAARRLTGKR